MWSLHSCFHYKKPTVGEHAVWGKIFLDVFPCHCNENKLRESLVFVLNVKYFTIAK